MRRAVEVVGLQQHGAACSNCQLPNNSTKTACINCSLLLMSMVFYTCVCWQLCHADTNKGFKIDLPVKAGSATTPWPLIVCIVGHSRFKIPTDYDCEAYISNVCWELQHAWPTVCVSPPMVKGDADADSAVFFVRVDICMKASTTARDAHTPPSTASCT